MCININLYKQTKILHYIHVCRCTHIDRCMHMNSNTQIVNKYAYIHIYT